MSDALLRLSLVLTLGALPAAAQEMDVVRLRVGDHPNHGRLVFDWPQPTAYRVEQGEDGVRLHFETPAAFNLDALRSPVRNLRRLEAEGQTATVQPAPGARLRHFQLDRRVVVDLLDPEAAAPPRIAAPEAAPAGMPTAARPPILLASAGGLAGALAQDDAPEPGPPRQVAQALPPLTPRPAPFQGRSLQAQAGPPGAAAAPPAEAPFAPPRPEPQQIRLEAGTGRLLGLGAPATTVMAADPRVARVQPSSPTSIFVMAVGNGRTTVIATDELGRPVAEFDVSVHGGREASPAAGLGALGGGQQAAPPRPVNAAAVAAQIRALLGGHGRVEVRVAGRMLALSGTVPTAADARRAEAIARGMANADTEIVNEIAVLSSIQVNLRVRVAEVSREVTRQFGLNWSAIGTTGNFAFGLATGSVVFPVPSGAFSHPDFLQRSLAGAATGGLIGNPQRLAGGFRSGSADINAVIDALAADNLITVLAEPNLTAQSGEVASFLAGGEFPIPVAARDNTISIEFKQFGVSLAFVPIVLGNDRLTLRVRPEVSELSDQGAVNLPTLIGTLRIPALSVRRAETTLELGSGQSFAIAGLLQRNTAQLQDGVNGLTDLPVLGALFRSDRFQRRETELVIIVTPYLVQPVSDPRALATPLDGFRPATSLERILHQRQLRGDGGPVPPVAPQLGFRLE